MAEERGEQLELLTQTSRGTPMGDLLRTFWHPIAIAAELKTGKAAGIKILGEELTLYRGASGKAYLIGGRCAHRRTLLHTGWVEGEWVRCMYHGWCFDGTGQCTEMPAEKPGLEKTVQIEGYPLHEYGGLLFAYMGDIGDGPAPEFNLPRKDVIEDPNRVIFPRVLEWDTNWFQQVENSLDALHVSYVHTWGGVSRFQEEIATAIPQLDYEETVSGILQTATRAANNVRLSDWTFPNNNHVITPGPRKGDAWFHHYGWVTPVDDNSALRFGIAAAEATSEEARQRLVEMYSSRAKALNPADFVHELFTEQTVPDELAPQLLATQDYVAIKGQGTIYDRSQERLGQSDAGIALFRRICFHEMAALAEGRPTKLWRKLDADIEMPIQSPESADT